MEDNTKNIGEEAPFVYSQRKEGILRALLAAPFENIEMFTSLARRLEFELRFC